MEHLLLNKHIRFSFSALRKLMPLPGLNLLYQISCSCQRSTLYKKKYSIKSSKIRVNRIFKQTVCNDYIIYPCTERLTLFVDQSFLFVSLEEKNNERVFCFCFCFMEEKKIRTVSQSLGK